MQIKCLSNNSSDQKDVVIVTVPFTNSSIPLMAPAVLKPIVEKTGMTCLAVDLNAELYDSINRHPLKHELVRFFFEQHTSLDAQQWINEMFMSSAQQILSWNPSIVCLSVFSYVCQPAAKWLAYYLKKLNPHIKIYIGGAGCLDTFTGPSTFAGKLIDAGIVDYHIRGDGEHSLYELLIGNTTFPGINSINWQQMSNEELAAMPIPDYANYDFSFYEKKVLPLMGSRGCIRKCTFCDYIANWKKFQWRTADDIFAEMIEQNKKYGIKSFKFQDSLTNGNLKEFRQLCKLLANHNNNNKVKFKWSGYYIFRDWDSYSDDDWKTISDSGAENLIVGIENLNEDIRYAIGKKFSNASIDLHLKEALRYDIKLTLLNIVGYVNEVREHIDFIKHWLDTHTKYKDLIYIQWGGTLSIFPDTYLETNKEKLGIIMIEKNPQSWINPTINSTPKLRAEWAVELNEYSRKLGYSVIDDIDNHYLLETLIHAD